MPEYVLCRKLQRIKPRTQPVEMTNVFGRQHRAMLVQLVPPLDVCIHKQVVVQDLNRFQPPVHLK